MSYGTEIWVRFWKGSGSGFETEVGMGVRVRYRDEIGMGLGFRGLVRVSYEMRFVVKFQGQGRVWFPDGVQVLGLGRVSKLREDTSCVVEVGFQGRVTGQGLPDPDPLPSSRTGPRPETRPRL